MESSSMDLWPSVTRHVGPPNRWQRWLRNVRETPSAVLLFVQILLLFIYPFIETDVLGRYAKALIGAAALVVIYLAVRVVRATPALTWVAAVLGGAGRAADDCRGDLAGRHAARLHLGAVARDVLLLHRLRADPVHVRRQLGDP
ncbi:hypothetical protein [Intrasporangium chromatireducens]|uniref:hypothetical protein n=1 Tax=Intrasporangium chromatireducens TaxID=1386088 RepID=UPI001F0AF5E4|nr:hypothetical protein [Intrasporangium chromatireducens]